MGLTGGDAFSQLLYPMLSEQPPAPQAVLDSLAAAPLEKSAESNRLRARLLEAQEPEILLCARRMADSFRAGGRLLACGNGGSATEAADLAAELLWPPAPWRPLPALCLTNDVAVVTAIANDVSFEDVFLRQVIAFGRRGDMVVAISTSGNSENLLRALGEARRRGLLTIGLVGYDGGRMLREGGLDHCFVVQSSSIHRIQEVQTSLHHLLIELVQRHLEEAPCA
jgi:D-sedoheptulose 7-phosphate isomerase